MAVRVGLGQGRRRLALQAEIARPIVLDQEGTGLGDHPQHSRPAVRGEHGAGRIGEGRLAVENTRAGAGKSLLQQIRPHPVPVHRHRDEPQPGGEGGGNGAAIGRAFHQHRVAGLRQGAEGGGIGGLGSGADRHLLG